MYFVYLLLCNNNSLYCGYTNNLKERFKKHNEGKAAKYTRSKLPVKLIYFEEHETQLDAMRREIQIKGWSRTKKISLIKHGQPS